MSKPTMKDIERDILERLWKVYKRGHLKEESIPMVVNYAMRDPDISELHTNWLTYITGIDESEIIRILDGFQPEVWGWSRINQTMFARMKGPREWWEKNTREDPDWPYWLNDVYFTWLRDSEYGGDNSKWYKFSTEELFGISLPELTPRKREVFEQEFRDMQAELDFFTIHDLLVRVRKKYPALNVTNMEMQVFIRSIPKPSWVDAWADSAIPYKNGWRVKVFYKKNSPGDDRLSDILVAEIKAEEAEREARRDTEG